MATLNERQTVLRLFDNVMSEYIRNFEEADTMDGEELIVLTNKYAVPMAKAASAILFGEPVEIHKIPVALKVSEYLYHTYQQMCDHAIEDMDKLLKEGEDGQI